MTEDQIAGLLARHRKAVKQDATASCGRRLIVTAWNPAEIPLMKGPPACHTFCQFDVTEGE